MRILFITQVILDEHSGRAQHVVALARALAKADHAVTLLAPGLEDPVAGVLRVRPPAGLRPGLRLEAALAARAACAGRRAEVAYVRLSASSSIVPITLAGLRLPFVLELNGPVIDEMRVRGRRLAAKATGAALRQAVALSAHVVAVDGVTARHARSMLGAQNVSIVENGANLDTATPGSRAEARARLGLPPEGPVVTFAGTLAPEQRLDLLFEAHRKLDGVTLVVAGGGAQAPLLDAAVAAARARAPVVALGVVPHDQAMLAIRAADICVDLRLDRTGLKCLEYAAVGRRIVTWRVDGAARLESLYPNLEAVHVVDDVTAVGLRRGLQAALESQTRRGPLPPEPVAVARATLGWEHAARRIGELLRQCV